MRGLLTGLVEVARATGLRESFMVPDLLDPEDAAVYRSLNQGSRDVPKYQHRRIQQNAIRAWLSNPFSRRLVEMPRDYMIAEGVAPISGDPAVQASLDDFWTDPINKMDGMVDTIALEVELLGEVVMPIFVGKDGKTRTTLLDTLLITDTITDPGNSRCIIGVQLGAQKDGTAYILPAILGPGVDDATVLSPKAVALRETWRQKLPEELTGGRGFQGVLYWGINRVSGMTRGLSGLSGSMDHADRLDQNLFDMLERTGFLSAFIWQVTLSGASPQEIAAWQTKYGQAPRPGTVRVGNEKETWDAVTPDLKLGDLSTGFRTARNYIAANQGFAPAWMGDVDGTRASAEVQGDPSVKTMTAKQGRLKLVLVELLQIVVSGAALAGKLPAQVKDAKGRMVDSWRTVAVMMPDMNPKDIARAAAAFQQVAAGTTQALSTGTLSKSTATRLLLAVAPHLGVEVATEDEITQAETEAQAADEAAATRMYAQLQLAQARLAPTEPPPATPPATPPPVSLGEGRRRPRGRRPR